MGDIIGLNKIQKKLSDLSPDIQKKVAGEIVDGTLKIHAEARKSIQKHMSKGESYGRHTASKPGFPPNTDTGRLVQSIEFEIDQTVPSGVVGTNLEYGKFLEFGTSNMRPRPWLSRAYGMFQKKIRDRISKVFRESVKK